MKSAIGYLRLMRPANIITAIADILMGFAATGAFAILLMNNNYSSVFPQLGFLILSTIGLYGGGVVFNDVFDAELDRLERPERPIPSGMTSLVSASILGSLLFVMGIFAAFMVNTTSGILSLTITVLALTYDSFSKHHPFLGPLNMGLCRGVNVLLGISIIPENIYSLWFLMLIPVIYIGAITFISQGEVHGGSRKNMSIALFLYLMVVIIVIILDILPDFYFWNTLAFLFFFIYIVFPPLVRSIKKPEPAFIKKAVKAGIIALIVLDSTIASGFAGWEYGIGVLLLLPLSMLLGKAFAVT